MNSHHIFNQEHFKSFVINMQLLGYFGFCKGEIHGKDTPGYSWPLTALPSYKALNLRGTLDNWWRFHLTSHSAQSLKTTKSNDKEDK